MKNFKSIFENKEEDIRPTKKDEGADDKEYLELMSQYKVTRHKDKDASVKILAQAMDLKDVSKKAKLAAAYL